MDFEWSPIELDRQIARAYAQWRGWKRRLGSAADAQDDPLAYFRSVLGLSFFRRLGELPETDALREPLRRWVYRLAEQRIDAEALTELALEWQRERPEADVPGKKALSARDMLERAVSDAPRREVWLRAWLGVAPPISAATVTLWQRRSEIARRMGVGSPASIESPATGEMVRVAREIGAALRERVRELSLTSLAGFIDVALGRDVAGDWPGRLTPARMLDYFRDGDLLRSLELEPKTLPSSLGAASTCRALRQLGGAWLEALAPRDQPFVVAHDAYGLMRHQAGALFALLPLNARFLERHAGVSLHARADVQRRLAQICLLELARAAFRVQLRPHALESERSFREAFSELAQGDLCLSIPRHAAGVSFALGVEDEQRLAGMLLAAEKTQALIEAHDEDWFRNPRAIEQLRAEAARPPLVRVQPEELARAQRIALRELERLLG